MDDPTGKVMDSDPNHIYAVMAYYLQHTCFHSGYVNLALIFNSTPELHRFRGQCLRFPPLWRYLGRFYPLVPDELMSGLGRAFVLFELDVCN